MIDGIVSIVKLVSGGVKVKLPLQEHETIESIFHGCVVQVERGSTRTWEIDGKRVQKTESTGKFIATHCKRFGC